MGALKRGTVSRLPCVYIRRPLPTARGRYRRRSPAHDGGTRAPERERGRERERRTGGAVETVRHYEKKSDKSCRERNSHVHSCWMRLQQK